MGERFLIPFGSICLIAFIGCGLWFQDSLDHGRTMASAITRNENLAVALQEYTSRTLQSADLVSRYVSAEASATGPQNALDRLLDGRVFTDSLFEGVGIIDENGSLIAASRKGVWPSLDFSGQDYFQRHQQGETNRLFVGKPTAPEVFGQIVVPLTRRISKADGSFGGVVIVQLAPARFTEIYKSVQLAPDDFISVLGQDGIIRGRRIGDHEFSGENFSSATLFAQAAAANAGSFLSEGFPAGMPRRLVTYRVLSGYDLIVAVGASEAVVLAEYAGRNTNRRMFGGGIAAFLTLVGWVALNAYKRRDMALGAALQSEEDMRYMANHDHLTGLANRVLLKEKVAQAMATSPHGERSLAILFIDLDNFKVVNDAHGHSLGDEILRAFAANLKRIVPANGVAARLGGDEFIVLLTELDDPVLEATECARRVLAELARPIVKEPREITVGASIGISVSNGATSIDALLMQADAAMYAAKEGGRRNYSFYADFMDRGAGERLRIEEELRKALQLGQLDLAYQPKVDLRTGTPVGVEALLRWSHPELGIVPPEVFIPVAEASGLILEIGEWVLRRACEQVRSWRIDGHGIVPMAVNVSALQFASTTFIDQVANALQGAKIPAASLELELTESMILDRPDLAVIKMKKLKELGVSLALDDFGTGYSNLHYLTKFPLDVLKVDRSFTSDLPNNLDAVSVAKAIITLGESLGLKVVAEGVETREQADFLRRVGCCIGQGYLFSRPLTKHQCSEWLKLNSLALHATYHQVA
ncbi:MAG: Cache and sensor-containing signal transduction diguanylate cyclase/phosphodiesterase [Hyphomicrobiales bacterium]|jgi:diguanylate cyclase (GGDEF)-like protein|nr:Cache and sensor-containing signal transduction diguanylate cyclase/phosphodiesterase [Hyphomicrobiales bacterium]